MPLNTPPDFSIFSEKLRAGYRIVELVTNFGTCYKIQYQREIGGKWWWHEDESFTNLTSEIEAKAALFRWMKTKHDNIVLSEKYITV